MTIDVLTPSLPERSDVLAECMRSVSAQTLLPNAHLVHIDHARAGEAEGMNKLAQASNPDWFAVLADDDLVDPHHLDTLATGTADADVVYTWCRVTGRDWNPNSLFDPNRLRALDAGARFICIPDVTWTYRFHDSNQTYRWHPEVAPRTLARYSGDAGRLM